MLEDLLVFAAVGFAAQTVDGAIGMAYGLSATSVLLTLGVAPATASASVHAAEVFTTGASGLAHWRTGAWATCAVAWCCASRCRACWAASSAPTCWSACEPPWCGSSWASTCSPSAAWSAQRVPDRLLMAAVGVVVSLLALRGLLPSLRALAGGG